MFLTHICATSELVSLSALKFNLCSHVVAQTAQVDYTGKGYLTLFYTYIMDQLSCTPITSSASLTDLTSKSLSKSLSGTLKSTFTTLLFYSSTTLPLLEYSSVTALLNLN